MPEALIDVENMTVELDGGGQAEIVGFLDEFGDETYEPDEVAIILAVFGDELLEIHVLPMSKVTLQ